MSPLETTRAMSLAWDAMADAATRFDGSYEAARERFYALQTAETQRNSNTGRQ